MQAPDGSWWMVLLGVRPGGGTPGWHVLGRETFLVPVSWVDGWPIVDDLSPVVRTPPWPLRVTSAGGVRVFATNPWTHKTVAYTVKASGKKVVVNKA